MSEANRQCMWRPLGVDSGYFEAGGRWEGADVPIVQSSRGRVLGGDVRPGFGVRV